MSTARTIHIGVIGAGMISQDHIKNLSSDKRCTVAALADVKVDAAAAVARQFRIPRTFADYRQVLDLDDLDAVIIATPPFLHRKMLDDVLSAGKHVLIEKPAAITPADVAAMVRSARRHPRQIVLEASCRHSRLTPKYRFVKKIIDSGALGEIYHIHHNAVNRQMRPGIEYHPAAKWFLNRKLAGGGPTIDWGVYDLSFHLGLLGDRHALRTVRSASRNGLDRVNPHAPVFDVEEHAWSYMEFDHGLSFYWERGSNAHVEVPNETRIYGTKGGLKLQYCTWESDEVTFFDVAAGGRGKARKKSTRVSYKGHVGDNWALDMHFLDCLTRGVKPAMPLELAAKHLGIIFAASRK